MPPIITAEEREMLLDHIASESAPTTEPVELTEKQREACHSDFHDTNGMDLLAELSNDMTDAAGDRVRASLEGQAARGRV
jgi:hypothetical protein